MATQPLFSPQFPSPALAPDLLRQQYQMQQNQAYAQALMQDGQQMPQGQMVSGHYVAPSPLQYAAQLFKTGIGRSIADQAPEQLANMQRTQQAYGASLFGLPSTPQQLGAALSGGGQTPAQTFPVGASGSPQQPPTQPIASQPMQPSPQALGAALRPQMPLLPGRTPEQSFQAFSLLGPAEYMKQVVSQGTPTDVVKNMVAAGIDPNSPQGRAYLQSVLAKGTYIAPVNLAPGGTLVDPSTRQPIISAPQNGVQTHYDAQGNASASAVPGYAGANAQNASAEAGATAQASAHGKAVGEMQGSIDSGARKSAAIGEGGAAAASVSSLDRMSDTANSIINSPGFNGVAGLSVDRLKSIVPGTDAANTVAQLNTLKYEVAQNVLQTYREMSKTGGAVGQVSEGEQKMFMNNLASLDRAQSPEQMKQSLTRIVNFVQSSKQRLKTAYDAQYGNGAFDAYMSGKLTMDGRPVAPVGREPFSPVVDSKFAQPKSEADFAKLPSGSVFQAPDGTIRRKP